MGPVSIMTGSTPTLTWSTMRARGRAPRARAFSAVMRSTAAAPSELCEAFPAVTRPPAWQARRAGDQRRGEIDGLLGGAALPIDGDGRGLDRQSPLQPGVASDVRALHPVLLHAARDHVLDRRGIDTRTVDHRREHRSEQLIW